MTHGADISHYQGDVPPVSFVWIKSSEGPTSRDRAYQQHRRMAAERGIPSGPYHFLRPGGSAVAQAQAFRRAAGPLAPGDLRPVADIEVPGFTVPWLRAFLEETERQFGCRPIIYASLGYLGNLRGLEGYDLWIAAYRANEPHPAGWNVVAWQYSDTPYDRDLTDDLTALLVGGGAPQPTTPPEVHPVSGSPRKAIAQLRDGRAVVYFEDGGAWISSVANAGTSAGATAAQFSVNQDCQNLGTTVEDVTASGDGVLVLLRDGHVIARYADDPGDAI